MATLSHSLSVFSDGSLDFAEPGSLWYLKSWREAGKAGLSAGNFTAVTLFADPLGKTGGQTNWVWLDKEYVDWVKSINLYSYKPWNWAAQYDGTIYLTNSDGTVRWPRIALGSPDDDAGIKNQVSVLEYRTGYVRIAGIPRGSFTDKPWLIHYAYTVFPDGWTSPNPLYRMPLLDPASGYKISQGETGLWLEEKWLHSRV